MTDSGPLHASRSLLMLACVFRGINPTHDMTPPSVHSSDEPPPLTHQQVSERKRLKNLHRQFSKELKNIEQDIFQASINKLKKEAAERGSREASVLSDAGDETESIGSNSDAFGDPFFQRERKR